VSSGVNGVMLAGNGSEGEIK